LAARIIGVGNAWAGDDGAGPAVIRALRKLDGSCDLAEVDDPAQLIELLTDGANPVVVVDAVADDGPAGRVVLIDPERHNPLSEHLLSTHGVGVMDAIELAQITHPNRVARRIFVVGITVQPISCKGSGLSPVVQAAVQPAARQALGLIDGL
jgi:hydrogenase maturation protease